MNSSKRQTRRTVAKLLHGRGTRRRTWLVVRLLVAVLILALVVLNEALLSASPVTLPALLLGGAIYLAVGLGIASWHPLGPAAASARRVLSVATDIIGITVLLLLTDKHGAYFCALYVLVAITEIGTEERARRYCGITLSAAGFVIVLSLSHFWALHKVEGVTLLIAFVCAFLYLELVVTRLLDAARHSEALNSARRAFLARMAHEIRTPLNVIIGMIGTLSDTELRREQLPVIGSMRQASSMLLAVVNDILDISKIEAGKLQIEKTPFDLHGLLNDLISLYDHEANKRGLRLWLEVNPRCPYNLLGDPYHLRQILSNLVDNALKFTSDGSVGVQVSLQRITERQVVLRFEVKDTGIGIDSEQQPRIFQNFYQADQSIVRRYGGTGLGTAICKQLVQMMGGVIGLDSAPGEGSIFWFEVPFKLALASAGAVVEPPLRAANVLLVGHKELALRQLGTMLQDWGATYRVAPTMRAAMEMMHAAAAEERPYTGIILRDTGGPDRVQLAAERLGARRMRRRCPIVVTAIASFPGRDAQYKAFGIADVHEGSIDGERLLNTLHAAIAALPGAIAQSSRGTSISNATMSSGLRVVVAEDDPLNREMLATHLMTANHYVVCVSNGQEALDYLEDNEADLLILDLNMPIIGGLEVYKLYVANRAGLPRAEAFILSADATAESIAECSQHGIGVYLTKPIDPLELLARVAAAARAPASKVAEPAGPVTGASAAPANDPWVLAPAEETPPPVRGFRRGPPRLALWSTNGKRGDKERP